MQTRTGYKVLQRDGTSLNGKFKYALPTNGKPGSGVTLPKSVGGYLYLGRVTARRQATERGYRVYG